MGRPGQGGTEISTVTAAPALRRDGEDITDHQLVARVRVGDDRAFEALYTRYHRRIASYIQGMVHDHARAEDIAQDVFMSALRRMRETDRPIAFKPWVYEIAKNACIDQFRRARRAEEVSMDADEGLGSADYGRLVSSGPTPDVAVDHKQQIDHLRGAFGGLSETHHEILVMRELEGLSYREIGEKLGMTRPAVESTLFRARRRLTEEYDQLVTGERCVRVQQIIATAGGSALGARDKRRVARHVSYCQPCLRHARLSGIDARDLVHKPVRQKIAALLPLPAFLKERWGGEEASHAQASFAQWSAQASSIDPGLVSSWSKAAATAATIALAGVSAGVATDDSNRLRGALPTVSLESLTGGGNPGGSGSADDLQAGSGGGSASGAATTAARASEATGGPGTSRFGGGAGGGTSTNASGGGSGSAGGSGDGAAREGVATLAGAGEAANDAGAGTGDGDDPSALIPDLDGSSTGGGGPNGGGNSDGDDVGDDDSGDPVGDVVSSLPPVEPPASGDASSGSGSGTGSGSGGNGGAGGEDDSGSPTDVGDSVGDKCAEIVGGLTGG